MQQQKLQQQMMMEEARLDAEQMKAPMQKPIPLEVYYVAVAASVAIWMQIMGDQPVTAVSLWIAYEWWLRLLKKVRG